VSGTFCTEAFYFVFLRVDCYKGILFRILESTLYIKVFYFIFLKVQSVSIVHVIFLVVFFFCIRVTILFILTVSSVVLPINNMSCMIRQHSMQKPVKIGRCHSS
jgi:hypothetical protein